MSRLDQIVKAYDIRGTVPDQLDADVARALGIAFARFAGGQEVLVARDMRASGVDLSAAFCDGVMSQGVDVVDLGLVYDVQISDDVVITLDMTLTSAACPLTDVIEDQATAALCAGPRPLANGVVINWVWMPPWGPEKITDEGREQLRALGFNV